VTTPDSLIRWYYAAREDIGAPGLDPVKSEGRVWARVCGAERLRGGRGSCRSAKWHFTANGERVCGHCGAAWRYRTRYMLRGEVQETVRNVAELAHARLVDIGSLLQLFLRDERWRWTSLIYVAAARGASHRSLVAEGAATYPEAPFQWTIRQVQNRIAQGRAEWARRLTRAGISVAPY